MDARPLLLAACCAAWSAVALAAGPATKPATTPAVPAAAAVSRELYTQAVAAYRGGDFATAIDLAEQQQRALLRARTKPTDASVVEAAHLQAVALMKLGQHLKAADVFAKTYPAMAGNRTLIFNTALCDMIGKTYAVRAARNLQSYATAHSDDEQIINLWGCAIDVAGSDGKNPAKVAELISAYTKIDAMLQATRPDMKRWGTAWLSAAEFAPIEANRAQQKQRIEDLRVSRDRAVAAYERAQAAYKRASAPITGRARASHEWWNDHCTQCLARERRNRMDAAQSELDYRRPIAESAAAAHERAVAEMPKPTWVMSMDPIDPFE